MQRAERRREYERRLRRPVPEQRAATRGRSCEPAAHGRELERLRLLLRPVLHDLQRRRDVVDRQHVDRACEAARAHRQRPGDRLRHEARQEAPRGGDVCAPPSSDGGLTWDPPAVVFQGHGCDLDKRQVFNDKEWITTDNNPHSHFYGRTYVTWTAFLSHSGEFVESPIMESHSDDGGRHWSPGQEISGNSRKL